MDMVKLKFKNDADRDRVVDLAKCMSVVALRGGQYVLPVKALELLDQWGCEYEVIERGGYDALVVRALRSVAAGTA